MARSLRFKHLKPGDVFLILSGDDSRHYMRLHPTYRHDAVIVWADKKSVRTQMGSLVYLNADAKVARV